MKPIDFHTLKKFQSRGTWLVQSVERVIFELRVVSLSPVLAGRINKISVDSKLNMNQQLV